MSYGSSSPAFGSYKSCSVFPGFYPDTGPTQLWGERPEGHLSLEQWEWGPEQ